jgi:hypothetical protein
MYYHMLLRPNELQDPTPKLSTQSAGEPVRWTDRGFGRMFWAGVGVQALSSAGFARLGMPSGGTVNLVGV